MHGPFDFLLLGECMYEAFCVEPLLTTAWELSTRGGDAAGGGDGAGGAAPTRVLLCGIIGDGSMAECARVAPALFAMEPEPDWETWGQSASQDRVVRVLTARPRPNDVAAELP